VLREFHFIREPWPLAMPFRIARGVRTVAEVIVVEVRQDGAIGRGEGAPLARYGETSESCARQLAKIADEVEAGLGRTELVDHMPAGAARNALDCALWDLEARLQGRSVSGRLSPDATGPVVTAMTIGLDTPAAMSEAARALAQLPLLKIKVNADDPAGQIRAARAGAPAAQMIVDANESWTPDLLKTMGPVLEAENIALLEQPLPAGQDQALRGLAFPIPICADESCHVAADLDGLVGAYQAVNIKLDKTGGLTAALDLLAQARDRDLMVMTGCMICTSLAIAPAFQLARRSDLADLDGPTWLKQDRPGGIRRVAGLLHPPAAALWGG